MRPGSPVGDRHPDPNTAGCTGPREEAVAAFWGGRRAPLGDLRGGAHRGSVGSAAGLQVRSLARGQHRGMVLLRKRPLVAPPVGSPTVPLADVTIQNVLDVLHDQVDGNYDRMNGSAEGMGQRMDRSDCTHPCPRGTRQKPRWLRPPGTARADRNARQAGAVTRAGSVCAFLL